MPVTAFPTPPLKNEKNNDYIKASQLSRSLFQVFRLWGAVKSGVRQSQRLEQGIHVPHEKMVTLF